MPETDILDVLDENGNKTGQTKMRRDIHRDGDWHAVVGVWFYNSKGEILLQKRSKNKVSYPGVWDVAAGGHVDHGESINQAITHEMKEEVGVDFDHSKLTDFGVWKEICNEPERSYLNREIGYNFLYLYDGGLESLVMDDGEVEELRFIAADDMLREIEDDKIYKTYFPHERDVYRKAVLKVKELINN